MILSYSGHITCALISLLIIELVLYLHGHLKLWKASSVKNLLLLQIMTVAFTLMHQKHHWITSKDQSPSILSAMMSLMITVMPPLLNSSGIQNIRVFPDPVGEIVIQSFCSSCANAEQAWKIHGLIPNLSSTWECSSESVGTVYFKLDIAMMSGDPG